MRTRALAVPLLLTALGILGCGSSSNSAKTTKSTRTTKVPVRPTPDHTYKVKLSGAVEVPPGAPAAGGTATITVNAAQHELCWKFRVVGVVHPTAAHVHAGSPGAAGPVVIPFGPVYAPNGCTNAVTASLIRKIEAAPSKYYVNVHNKAFPNGAARAQL